MLLGTVQVTLIASITVVNVALPAMQREMDLGESDLVTLASAYSLSFGCLLLLGGRVADLFGPRVTFLTGTAVFAVASAAAAASPTFPLLAAARFGQGAGAALAAPACMALLASLFPAPEEHARALATWGVLASMGASIGVVLSGAILTWVPWRWLFVLPTVVALVVLVASMRVLPPGPRKRSESLDTVGAALLTVAIFVLLVGFRDLHAVWTCVGVALLALFVVHLIRSATPLIPLHLLQSRHRATALVAIMAASAAMACCYFILALYFQQVRGFSPAQTSLALLPTALAILVAVMLARHLMHVASSRTITATGLAMAAAGLWMMAGLRDNASYDGALMLGLSLFPFGAGLAFSGATTWAASGVVQREAGVVGGMTNTALELGPPFGLALLVPLATSYGSSLRGPSLELATGRGYGLAFTAAALALLVLSSFAIFDRTSRAPVRGRRCRNSHVPTQPAPDKEGST